MSSYVHGTSLSYLDYLQARSFETSITREISKQTRSIIASNGELQQLQISVGDAISDVISEGFDQLNYEIQNISASLSELNATFEWGFSELLTAVGYVNDSLTSLVRIARTPAQTWAYEQFDIARDAYRKDLYEEALEYLNRAINGHAGNTGYKLEYRFHYLLGTIRLGSFKNHSKGVLDLGAAEKAFLNAARYAVSDAPTESGRAFLAAGWAAYCQGNIRDANAHTERAVSLYPALAEAHFQLAKLKMQAGHSNDALLPLRQAIELDRGYAIKAGSDEVFQRSENILNSLLNDLRQSAKVNAASALQSTLKDMEETERLRIQEFEIAKYAGAELGSARKTINEATDAAANDTYFGYLDAISLCSRAAQMLAAAKDKFIAEARIEIRRQDAELNSQISGARGEGVRGIWILAMVFCVIATCVLSFKECSRVYDANTKQEQVRQLAKNRMMADIKRKGYDPFKLTIAEGRRLGFRLEDLPPNNIGATSVGTWLWYMFWGLLISIGVPIILNKIQKSARISRLERERGRLQGVDAKVHQSALPESRS